MPKEINIESLTSPYTTTFHYNQYEFNVNEYMTLKDDKLSIDDKYLYPTSFELAPFSYEKKTVSMNKISAKDPNVKLFLFNPPSGVSLMEKVYLGVSSGSTFTSKFVNSKNNDYMMHTEDYAEVANALLDGGALTWEKRLLWAMMGVGLEDVYDDNVKEAVNKAVATATKPIIEEWSILYPSQYRATYSLVKKDINEDTIIIDTQTRLLSGNREEPTHFEFKNLSSDIVEAISKGDCYVRLETIEYLYGDFDYMKALSGDSNCATEVKTYYYNY